VSFFIRRRVLAADHVYDSGMTAVLAELDVAFGHFCQIEARHFLRENLCVPDEDTSYVSSS